MSTNNTKSMNAMFAEIDSAMNGYKVKYVRAEPNEGKHTVVIHDVNFIPAKKNLVDAYEETDKHTGEIIKHKSYIINENLPADAIIKPEALAFTFRDVELNKLYSVYLSNFQLKTFRKNDPCTMWEKFMDNITEQHEILLNLPLSKVLKKLESLAFDIWTYKAPNGYMQTVYNQKDFEYWAIERPKQNLAKNASKATA